MSKVVSNKAYLQTMHTTCRAYLTSIARWHFHFMNKNDCMNDAPTPLNLVMVKGKKLQWRRNGIKTSYTYKYMQVISIESLPHNLFLFWNELAFWPFQNLSQDPDVHMGMDQKSRPRWHQKSLFRVDIATFITQRGHQMRRRQLHLDMGTSKRSNANTGEIVRQYSKNRSHARINREQFKIERYIEQPISFDATN